MRSLLRSILREHRVRLPREMRELGDRYVMKEFRDTRSATEVEVLQRFRGAWEQSALPAPRRFARAVFRARRRAGP